MSRPLGLINPRQVAEQALQLAIMPLLPYERGSSEAADGPMDLPAASSSPRCTHPAPILRTSSTTTGGLGLIARSLSISFAETYPEE